VGKFKELVDDTWLSIVDGGGGCKEEGNGAPSVGKRVDGARHLADVRRVGS
jgi:hypothetical protein